jgi:hypothetical protein
MCSERKTKLPDFFVFETFCTTIYVSVTITIIRDNVVRKFFNVKKNKNKRNIYGYDFNDVCYIIDITFLSFGAIMVSKTQRHFNECASCICTNMSMVLITVLNIWSCMNSSPINLWKTLRTTIIKCPYIAIIIGISIQIIFFFPNGSFRTPVN